jgi:ADP-heptose:LPS heptosyltransferase
MLIVRVGALGDTLMVTPLVRLLHELRPKTEIDFLSSDRAAPLLELNPHLANLFRLKGRNTPLALSLEKRRLVHQLRAREYGLAVLLESAPRYRTLVEMAGPRQISSFREVPFDAGLHAIVNNLHVAGIDNHRTEDIDMDLPLAPDDDAAAGRMLRDLPGPRVGIHIGWGPLGRKRDQARRLRGWEIQNFNELIHMLLDCSVGSVVLTGSEEDTRDTQILRESIPDGRLHSFAGRTRVRELAAVIKNLDLLISVDSGPCHMAAALGTPLVVLWGPGRLEQTRPISSFTPIRIVRHPVPCAPCQSTPLQKSCRRNLCMESISPQDVFDEARCLLPSILT